MTYRKSDKLQEKFIALFLYKRNPLFIKKLLNQLTTINPEVAVSDNGERPANQDNADEFSVRHAGQTCNHDHDIGRRNRGQHADDKEDLVASFIINLALILVKGFFLHKEKAELFAIGP